MTDSSSFLGPSELEQYNQPGRRLNRFIVRSKSKQKDGGAPAEKGLQPYLFNRLKTLFGGEYKNFECCFINITEGDGSSWSAQVASDVLTKHFPHLYRWCLADQLNVDNLPLVANFIGIRDFLKTAVANKLTTSFYGLRSWLTPLIIITAVLVGIATKALQILLKSKTAVLKDQPVEMLSDPWFLGGTGLLIVLGLLSKQISVHLTTKTKSKSIQQFVEKLKEEQFHKKNFKQFIDDLAAKLSKIKLPRVVIIDNFDRLDKTTRMVVFRYLQYYAQRTVASEYWVVFETDEYRLLSSDIYTKSCTYTRDHSEHFSQRLLNTDEKRKLIAQLELESEPEDYTSVKGLCQGNEQAKKSMQKLFQNHRLLNPSQEQRYGTLDFLYLLSITSYPGKTPLEDRFLVNSLSAKSGLQGLILDQFLRGTRRQKLEFRQMLTSVRNDFDSGLVLEDRYDPSRITVHSEMARYLEKNAAGLSLSPPGLGHLFWGLFWYNKLRNDPIQAFFIRKLAHHLVKLHLTGTGSGLSYGKIIRDIYEAHLFTIDGAMKICLFELVPTLLQNILDLMDDENFKPTDSDLKRLYERSWEAYFTLGDEKILNIILEIFTLSEPATAGDQDSTPDLLEMLYFDSLSLPHSKRALLKANYSDRAFGNQHAIEAISNYAKARSAWFSATILQMSRNLDPFSNMNIVNASIQTQHSFYELSDHCQKRVFHGPKDHRRIIDILSLSLMQWSSGLNLGLILNGPKNGDNAILQFVAHLHDLVDSAESMVILSNELVSRYEQQEAVTELDYLLSVLLKETCLIAVTSILIAERCFTEFISFAFDKELITKTNQIVEDINDMFDFQIPGVASLEDFRSPKLYEKIDSLLKLCCIIYRHFKLSRLHDFLELRRLQFNRICLGVELSAPERIRSFSDSLSAVLDCNNYTGILANFVMANTVHEAIELRAHYILSACKMAAEGNYGGQLKKELSMLAINETHGLGMDESLFIEQILHSTPGQPDYLETLLKTVPVDDLTSITMCLLNTAYSTASQKSKEGLINQIEAFVKDIDQADLKTELEALIDYYKLKNEIQSGQVTDADTIIDQWSNRKDLWMYVGVLNFLLESGCPLDKIAGEVFRVLDRDPEADVINVQFNLSLDVTARCVNSQLYDQRCEIAYTYLKQSIFKWKKLNPVEVNLRAYKLLNQISEHQKDEYMDEIVRWQIVKIERDNLQRLPMMAKHGQFFLIFYDYFESMVFWGLRTELDFKAYYDQHNLPPEKASAYLHNWKSQGGEVPTPLIAVEHRNCVSSQFLHLGHFLFKPPASNDPKFNDDRQRVNRAAHRALPELVTTICSLPSLPQSVSTLLKQFSIRYQSYKLPENG